LLNFEGISASTAGSKHLCMHIVVIPPGGKAVAHYHNGYETAIYIIKGRAETKYGENLEQLPSLQNKNSNVTVPFIVQSL
jgi:uncharacterized RmlC-like cupin family protein